MEIPRLFWKKRAGLGKKAGESSVSPRQLIYPSPIISILRHRKKEQVSDRPNSGGQTRRKGRRPLEITPGSLPAAPEDRLGEWQFQALVRTDKVIHREPPEEVILQFMRVLRRSPSSTHEFGNLPAESEIDALDVSGVDRPAQANAFEPREIFIGGAKKQPAGDALEAKAGARLADLSV